MFPFESVLTTNPAVFPLVKDVDDPAIKKPLSAAAMANARSSPVPPYVFSHNNSFADKEGTSELPSRFE
jgi:hypothetical protein